MLPVFFERTRTVYCVAFVRLEIVAEFGVTPVCRVASHSCDPDFHCTSYPVASDRAVHVTASAPFRAAADTFDTFAISVLNAAALASDVEQPLSEYAVNV